MELLKSSARRLYKIGVSFLQKSLNNVSGLLVVEVIFDTNLINYLCFYAKCTPQNFHLPIAVHSSSKLHLIAKPFHV